LIAKDSPETTDKKFCRATTDVEETTHLPTV
jgi:hypothetical protein